MIRRLLAAMVALAVVAAVAYAVVVLTADEAVDDELVIVVDEVERADLRDTVVLRGQVAREESFVLTAGGGGRVTALSIGEDDVVGPGDELLRLNDRPMVIVDDSVPYWRPLSELVDDGPDVERLEQFLADGGHDPGEIDRNFTATTRDALEDWQEANDYPVDGTFLPTDVATGSWPSTVGPLELSVGDTVAAGQPLVGFVDSELSVTVQIDPTDRTRLTTGLAAVVTVPATGAEGTGSIAELAEAASIDAQGVERYRGEVELDGELGVVDGTAVRIEVILAEVTDALVVPVAAVSLSGDGREEVRILNEAGTIDRVPIETGLTEGALVEVVAGLDGTELVVVEVRE